MKLSKIKITNKGLYWGLILTFLIIYVCVGFVSTLHAITFFQMANTTSLAVLLALAFEVGQSSVLFSILMAKKGDERFLPWVLMILLTGLQIIGNVFSSFKHIMTSGNLDWQYFQKSILFGVQAANPEMYQVIISWLQGALLPIVALGLTALVAQKINILVPREEEITPKENLPEETKIENIVGPDRYWADFDKTHVDNLDEKSAEDKENLPEKVEDINKPKETFKDYLGSPTHGYLLTKEEEPTENLDEVLAKELDSIEPPSKPSVSQEFDKDFIVPEPKKIERANRPDTSEEVHKEWDKMYDEINKELDEEAERLTPKITEQMINDVAAASELAMQKAGKKELEINKDKEFDKDFIVPEQIEKKRGRPPKATEQAVEPKKEQEFLAKEEAEVPQKESPQAIENPKKEQDRISFNNELKDDLDALESIESRNKTPYVDENGVSVLDAKAIPKQEEVKKNQIRV